MNESLYYLGRNKINIFLGAVVRRSFILALVISLAIPVSLSTPAPASNPTLNFLISPPTVQNTFVTGARVATFNDKTAGNACPTEWFTDPATPGDQSTATKIGDITTTGCTITAANKFGGAALGADENLFPPTGTTLPVTGTNFVSIPSNKETTLTLTRQETYLGFWWSAGDQYNKVTLFNDNVQVGVFTTDTLKALLDNRTSTDLVTAIDGNQYQKCRYWGNPLLVDRKTGCVGDSSTYNANQPYAYIHLIGEGGLEFNKLVFEQGSGGSFEFDNMAIARNVVSPPSFPFPAELNANTPDLVGTTCDPFPTSFGLVSSNFAQTPTYSISPTTLPPGLTFNEATGTISGTATSTFSRTTYTVTATAQTIGANPVTQTASTTVSLAVTACPPPPPKPPTPVVWEPETTTFEVTEFPAIITPDPPPPPPGGGIYTFTGDPSSTSNCEVDKFTSTMTVPQPGTCVVTATVGETKKLGKASITVTFTITGPALAATGAPAWPVWAGVLAAIGGSFLVWARLTQRFAARASRLS